MLDRLAALAEQDPEHMFTVTAAFILAVANLKGAAALVVQSDGAYDLEHLNDSIIELEDA